MRRSEVGTVLAAIGDIEGATHEADIVEQFDPARAQRAVKIAQESHCPRMGTPR